MRLLYSALFVAGVVIGFMTYAPAPVVRYINMSEWTEADIMRLVMKQKGQKTW